MLVPNQYFDIKIIKTNIEHYRSLGYDVQLKDIITVPAEHLTKGSHQEVQVECDCCGKKFPREYKAYLTYTQNNYDYCQKCATSIKSQKTLLERYGVDKIMDVPGAKDKQKQTNLMKYGVENYAQTEECKQKMRKTCMEKYGYETTLSVPQIREKRKNTIRQKYGVEDISQLDFVKEKRKSTCLDIYGVEYPSQSETIKKKIKSVWLEKYGVEHPLQYKDVQDKIKKTCLERYGVEHISQNPEIRKKMMETMYRNGTVATSSQQLELFNIVKKKYPITEINYPFDLCSLDIFVCTNNVKIDIEYDGWYWHQDKHRDLRRDLFLQQNGFKILRIRSGNKLPTEEQLFEAINKLINTDRKYTEIILDDWKEGEITA